MGYRFATAAAVAAALTLAGAGVATAATPTAVASCGTTLTGAGYLPHDLTCTGDVGVNLAGDATLDLRGHRLTGPGSSGVGVQLSPTGRSTVVHGTIRGWSAAIATDTDSETSFDATVTGLRLVGNRAGLYAYGFPGALHASRLAVLNNTTSAVSADYGADITITESVLRNNPTGLAIWGAVHADRLVITGSQKAVSCYESACEVSHSLISDSETGVYGWAARGTYEGNTFARNDVAWATGFSDRPSTTHFEEEVRGNRFVGNDVAVRMDGIASTAFRRNTFTGNGIGITNAGPNSDSFVVLMEQNTFKRNGDGIRLLDIFGTALLSGNRAVRNTGWGIYAPQATDLGDNTASGNGNEPQCVGVVCAS